MGQKDHNMIGLEDGRHGLEAVVTTAAPAPPLPPIPGKSGALIAKSCLVTSVSAGDRCHFDGPPHSRRWTEPREPLVAPAVGRSPARLPLDRDRRLQTPKSLDSTSLSIKVGHRSSRPYGKGEIDSRNSEESFIGGTLERLL